MGKTTKNRTNSGPEVTEAIEMAEIGTNTGPINIPTVKVYLKGDYADKYGKMRVILVVHIGDKRMNFNTGVKVEPKHWDDQSMRVRRSMENYEDLNLIIDSSKAKLTNVFIKYRLQDKFVTYEILKDEYERPNTGFDYLDWMKGEIDNRRGTVGGLTINQFRAHMLKMKAYKNTVAFAELSEDFFADFNRYLMVTKKNGSNTRWNTLKTHRTFMNIAKRKGIIVSNPLDHMPVKRAQTDRVFLDDQEVEVLVALYRKKTLPENYQGVLRHFLFSCFTGLRISDLRAVRMEDIFAGILILMPIKTKNTSGITVRIPLSKTALELIKDESPYRIKGLIFNCLSEAKMREYLKLVIGHAKIKKAVIFHSSRHTFATRFLRKTNNLAALQKLLGHQNIERTMIYAHIMTEDLTREIGVFD